MKKKTHEEYVAELAVKNPNVEVIGKYIDSNTKIMHRCLVDGFEWSAIPNNTLKGRGCPKCGGKIKRTHEEYVKEVSIINPNIKVREKYINSKTPILHKCIIHNIEWNARPSNILRRHGCRQCRNELLRKQRVKDHTQYIEELNKVNPNIIPIEDYVNANTSILHKCLIDKYEWKAKPNNILIGRGCPQCGGNIQKTHETYINEVLSVNTNIEVIEKYISAKTPILHRCKKHNVQWKVTPSNILNGVGCCECSKEKIGIKNRKNHEEYIEELKEINPNIIALDTYINTDTPLLHKCLVDGNEWYTRPANILNGTGCPKCNESKGERKIRLWLDKQHVTYEFQKPFNDCCDILPLPFDFYLPTYNVIIEYDGKQHFEPIEYFGGQEKFEIQQKHDAIKNEYCKNNGIPLLRIPYYKYKNIEEELNNFLFI